MDYDVMEARYVRDRTVWLRFRDGSEGEVDLGGSLHGQVFEPLGELDYFRRFRVDPECHTLVWPNEADLAPEYLYECVRATAELNALRSRA